ncbi:helix-turn-helix domain-containing protein [Solibacillus isronensis]|uniref:helix-turn-helix domain-containing protein n=1 Tax=Solibacillus isronensis TaxID=412383 RepID=UPI00203F0527|nr:helix-turn-helix domain-containing protein [Solibacillus isronensis]MCM3724058.1 helix-turn-helix domain-containing protein [Solibacillus isronensis]
MNLKRKNLNDVFHLPKDEALTAFYDRMITIPTTARTALKKELLSIIGEDRSKGVFVRYGWHCGVSDARKAKLYHYEDELELILGGTKFHMLHGYVDRVSVSDIHYDEKNYLKKIDVIWENSFEADEFLADGNLSDRPICHTLCGYASGYLSTVLEKTILVKEVECRAMGYEQCKVICMPLEEWGHQEHEYSYYQSTSIIQELDEITAKLKIERDYLKQANEVQRKLTHALLSKQGLQKIVNLLNESTGLPIFIENETNEVIIKSADVMIDFELEKIDIDTTEFITITPELGILRTPIYFEEQIKGYCSFIYQTGKKPTELEYMIIDKTALTASVILLNENIKIGTEQNIKRSFLSDVLDGKLEQDEIYKIAHYLNFPPTESYWLLTLERTLNHSNISDEIEVNEELIRQIILFLNERNINALVSQKTDKLIILIEYPTFKRLNTVPHTFINQLLKYCLRRFKSYEFYIGASTVIEDLSQINILYNETLAALKAKNPEKHICFYEDLEIEGVLFQIKDEVLIDRFVMQQLGKLLEIDKDYDLTKTIYTYIENGININKTAKALSMSISGLRYRLSKISEILNIGLDDTKRLFSVYMALKVLKVKNQIIF